MNDAARLEWLEAMGIDVWVERDRPADTKPGPPLTLKVCPGRGSTLLVCGHGSDTASTLAADIVRALGGDPVWSWPQAESPAEGESLESSVRERLFTAVIVFGQSLAETLFGGHVPETIESARVVCCASLPELSHDADARRQLWSLVCANHLCAS